jgi:formyltetrahydrofolate-dependent phosphoribosylglycinamide formyltransferase
VTARLVCLVSGTGSLAAALVTATSDPAYGAEVVAFGADRRHLAAFDVARAAGIPTFVERIRDHADRASWDAALTASVASYRPDLVVSAGFMKLLGPRFLAEFGGRTLNTHPALLPSFPGMHGPADALAHGVKVSGATLFMVDAGIDSGPIVAQRAVEVLEGDTVESLHERIKGAERLMVVDAVGRMVREGFSLQGRRVRIGS